jgi:hypothetical protein
MAASSASKVCRRPRQEDPCAMGGQAPSASVVITNPQPADRRNDPSVQACHMSLDCAAESLHEGSRCYCETRCGPNLKGLFWWQPAADFCCGSAMPTICTE